MKSPIAAVLCWRPPYEEKSFPTGRPLSPFLILPSRAPLILRRPFEHAKASWRTKLFIDCPFACFQNGPSPGHFFPPPFPPSPVLRPWCSGLRTEAAEKVFVSVCLKSSPRFDRLPSLRPLPVLPLARPPMPTAGSGFLTLPQVFAAIGICLLQEPSARRPAVSHSSLFLLRVPSSP